MSTGSGDLQCSLGDLLSLHLRQIRPALGGLGLGNRGCRDEGSTFQMRQQCKQVGRSNDVELTGPACLAPLRRRTDKPFVET